MYDVTDSITQTFMPAGNSVPSECGIQSTFGVLLLQTAHVCHDGYGWDSDMEHCCPAAARRRDRACEPACGAGEAEHWQVRRSSRPVTSLTLTTSYSIDVTAEHQQVRTDSYSCRVGRECSCGPPARAARARRRPATAASWLPVRAVVSEIEAPIIFANVVWSGWAVAI